MWVQSLGQEDPVEEEVATGSSVLAWKIPWTEEPGGLQSGGRKESDRTEVIQHAQVNINNLGDVHIGRKERKTLLFGNTNSPQACVLLVGRSVASALHCEAIFSGKVTLFSGPGGGCVSQCLYPVSGPQACSMGTPSKIYLIINRSSGLGTQQHWV